MERLPITKQGYERLQLQLERMKGPDRRQVAAEIEEARSHGDLRENADYDAAKEKQGMLEASIRLLESQLARAQIIDIAEQGGERVVFGATVTLLDIDKDEERIFKLVGEAEANPDDGLISIASPVARALLGKECGDVAEVRVPNGLRSYEVIEIEFIV